MPTLRAIPRAEQRDEPWANGAGSTTVILREPDNPDWRLRVSVARVECDGPFSDLPATRRTLVPLDGPMTLRFPDGRELRARRLEALRFDGSPAPDGLLPAGPTRDFNLMLRGDARGDVLPRRLEDSMPLPAGPGPRWLVYLDDGHAVLRSGVGAKLQLNPGDVALVIPDGDAAPTFIEGHGEIILVKLYA